MHHDQTDGGLHNDQTDADPHNDQTDGDLHNDHTLIFKFTYWNIRIKVEIKMIQYVCIRKLHKLIILQMHRCAKFEVSTQKCQQLLR